MLGSLYSESSTWMHRVPAAIKLIALAVWGVALFAVHDAGALLALLVVSLALFVSMGQATRPVRRLLASVTVAAALVMLLHLGLGQPRVGLISFTRLVGVAALGMAVTVSTSATELLGLVERVLAPFERWGVQPTRVALRVALMLRFTEHFFIQWQRLDDAYRVRTGKSGGLRLIAPLTILMLQAARRVADTLQVRLGE